MSDHLGPLHYLAVEFVDGELHGEVFEHLVAQVEAGTIFLLDLEFVERTPDGSLIVLPPTAPALKSLVGCGLAGEDAGLLDAGDIELLARDIGVGSLVAVMVYEDRSMISTIEAVEMTGGRVVSEGAVDLDALDTILSDHTTYLREVNSL